MNLADLTVNEIKTEFSLPDYKAKQLYKWIRRGETDFAVMTDLSLDFRNELSEKHEVVWPQIYMKFASKLDETHKYLVKLEDDNIIETVLMKYEHGYSICISSQVGCRMGCAFCASTIGGLIRNLTPSEIEGQIRAVSKDSNVRISNVVIMGIGEPLDNYDNIIKALKAINNPDGLNIGYRHITLSTCGLAEGIKKLMNENIPITLALSLHAPNDEIRKAIMPAAKAVSVKEIISLCAEYAEKTGRRVTFEYALISGVNDSAGCALQLGELLKGILCHVNLIDVNPVEGKNFKRGNKKYEFVKLLEEHGINATVRRELGKDISASCGQLRKSVAEEG
ncbi:MAG: 23S rRNA (adenine(2503)-C(2))-methyltransferase RlmN [Bacillota bacterium]|nr:23S rRNA (adenine(2503)-C(2))-methyltransferase RlmN [Bacillota bacterium]